MSGNGDHGLPRVTEVSLKAIDDARKIIRLFQCSQCSHLLREPMTLPCGNSLCRPCLPPLHKRENITYPLEPGRTEGFICPFKSCGLEHSLGDCSIDVTLSKLMEVFREEMSRYHAENSDTSILLDERPRWRNVVDSSDAALPHSRVLHGGRIVATYVFAELGELDYHSEVSYIPTQHGNPTGIDVIDVAVFERLKEATRTELECQVCYALMLDPLTTSCGHTFCRKCVARVLDHSNLCPVCRRRLPMPPGVQAEPSNKRISYILTGLQGELYSQRAAASAEEDVVDDDQNMPLFPCTLAYPLMPTFLHIFEPRYRLMMRRAIESGGRQFGILMYNARRQPQGHLGPVHFMQYGTLLHIQRVEMFPDGRCLVETQGVSRFRVLETSLRDGYIVGKIQRVDDISVAEEEAIEARETTGEDPPAEDYLAQIQHMSTQALLQHGLDFIQQARTRSASWLHERVLAAYGMPPSDPATFPYWFASVLPIAEDEKYLLLPTTSVRQRLKITARWIQRLQEVRWAVPGVEALRSALNSSSGSSSSAGQEPAPAILQQSTAPSPELPESAQVVEQGATESVVIQSSNDETRAEDHEQTRDNSN